VYGSIQVAGRIAEIAGNRHSVDGACICGRPQWLFDAGFYFWYKGYISFSLKFRCETWNIIKNYRINGLKCQKNIDMYRQAGGNELVHRIMEKKRAEGTTIFTVVHHRETPLRILKKTVDVGPVWETEAIHAKASGLLFDVVEPGEDLDQRNRINYYVCKLKHARHSENADKFIEFIRSSDAQQIYQKYGFLSHL
jgi:hypothetical protein